MDARSHLRFPHLDHFLNACMHQDWRMYGDDLTAVVATYAADTPPDGAERLQAEIEQFLRSEGSRVETDYYQLYPNSALPSAWDTTAADWLRLIARLAGNPVPVHH
jgi:hypothetical protein